MNLFYDYLYKYGLHDCAVNDIFIENEKIVFCFDSGVYELDDCGKERNLTESCKMKVKVAGLNQDKLWEHVEINRVYKGTICETEYDDFVQKVKEINFDIDINYYSRFCNSILLKGYIKDEKYEVEITEVSAVEFVFF